MTVDVRSNIIRKYSTHAKRDRATRDVIALVIQTTRKNLIASRRDHKLAMSNRNRRTTENA